MQDFAVEQDNYGLFDLVIEDGQFKSVDGLETAVDYQLFVDRRASASQIAVARSRQGWIGDLATKREGYQAGSLLYLQRQARGTPSERLKAAAYAEDAVRYFVSVGAAQRVSARVVGELIEGVIEVRGDDVNRYTRLWKVTDAD